MTQAAELFEFGAEPEWKTCRCGALSAAVPCWECSRAGEDFDRRVAEERAAVGTIPRRFAWARVGASELVSRVRTGEELDAVARRVLASRGAVFAGPSGSGKTSLACACLREWARAHGGGLFVSAFRLSTARIQHAAGDGEAGIVARALAAPLLLIDEVGGEERTATSSVKAVVFQRYDEDRPTWITTGLSGKEIAAVYGDGFARRVVDGAAVVKLGGVPA